MNRSLIPFCVAGAYVLGVQNERAFPGDRWWPLPGELPFWLGLFALTVLATALAERSRS